MGAHVRSVGCVVALVAACTSRGIDHDETIDRLDCDACHSAEYDAASFHAERGYPRACYGCHGTSDWHVVTAHHEAFPINSEPHAGFDCSTCHLNLDDPEDITCIECHAHSEDRTAYWHYGNGEYEWTPRSCYRCHRSGGSD